MDTGMADSKAQIQTKQNSPYSITQNCLPRWEKWLILWDLGSFLPIKGREVVPKPGLTFRDSDLFGLG